MLLLFYDVYVKVYLSLLFCTFEMKASEMDFVMFFFNMVFDLFNHGWLGIILGSLLVLIMVVIVGLIAWGVFHAFDSWFLPEQQAQGVIISRSHSPAHWQPMVTTIPNGSGGSNTIVTQMYIPASWSVTVRMGDRTSSMGCSESYYDDARQDQRVTVHYVDGRLSSRFYVRALS